MRMGILIGDALRYREPPSVRVLKMTADAPSHLHVCMDMAAAEDGTRDVTAYRGGAPSTGATCLLLSVSEKYVSVPLKVSNRHVQGKTECGCVDPKRGLSAPPARQS